MLAPVRIAFDVSLPVVATEAFTTGGRRFGDGESVPWRELGVSESDLYAWWQANLVRFVPAESEPIVPPRTKPPQAPPRARR